MDHEMRGITRLEYSRNTGYWVRLGYSDGNPKAQKYFPITRYASWTSCLTTAKKWRNKREAEMLEVGEMNPYCAGYRNVIVSSNTSGKNGVHFSFSKVNSKSKEKLPCWVVSYSLFPNKNRNKRFFWHTNGGDNKSFLAAFSFRLDMEIEIDRLTSTGERHLPKRGNSK